MTVPQGFVSSSQDQRKRPRERRAIAGVMPGDALLAPTWLEHGVAGDGGGTFWGGVILSFLSHLLLLFLLLYHRAPAPAEPPSPPPIEMVYEKTDSPARPVKAAQKGEVPAPPAPVESKVSPSPEPPKPQAPPAPPPPVPPPPPRPHSAPETASKAEKPIIEQKSPPQEKGEISQKAKSKPAPQKHAAQLKAPTHEAEKKLTTPMASHTEQPHETKKMQADSHSLLSTLNDFRTEQKESPPRAAANPPQGGSPRGGGSPEGDTRALSTAEQKAIGASVRRCYQEDTAARNYASFVAHLVVTVDASGMARLARFSAETAARMKSDMSYRALAERARAAVLSPDCARLPIPTKLLGQTRELRFVFRP